MEYGLLKIKNIVCEIPDYIIYYIVLCNSVAKLADLFIKYYVKLLYRVYTIDDVS